MARHPRNYESGLIYHLTAHGVDQRAIFRDDLDRQDFVIRLTRVAEARSWRCFAICLMTTHFHLIVSSPQDGALSAGMRELSGGYARAFNTRHRRRGVLFESRHRDWQIRDDDHLLEAIRYVALNPVRAGMVDRPEDWTWSTYGQLIGLRKPWPCFVPVLVLSHFGRTREEAIACVQEFVAEATQRKGVRHRSGV